MLWDTWRLWDGPSRGKVFHYCIGPTAPQQLELVEVRAMATAGH